VSHFSILQSPIADLEHPFALLGFSIAILQSDLPGVKKGRQK
jgi:hypothetical protein